MGRARGAACSFSSRYARIGLLAAIGSTIPAIVHADERPPSMVTVNQRISEAVKRFSIGHNLGIDPRLVDELRNNALLFTGNFCLEPPQPECALRFENETKFDQIVSDYLSELSSNLPKKMGSIADKLADGKLGMAGWPSDVGVEVGAVILETDTNRIKSSVKTATGTRLISDEATRLVLPAGSSTLILQIDEVQKIVDVTVEAGKTMTIDIDEAVSPSQSLGLLWPRDDAFCYERPPSGFEGPLAIFNWGRATFVEPPAAKLAHLAPFAQQPVMKINAVVDGNLECSADCQRDLASLFAEAIAVWRSGCSRCDPNSLALIIVGPHIWLDARITQRLRAVRSGIAQDLDLRVPYPKELQVIRKSPAWYGTSFVVPYDEITSDRVAVQQICSLSPAEGLWIGSTQAALCGAKDVNQTGLRAAVFLRDRGTDCGNIAIACGLPQANIQLNGGFYQFWIPSLSKSDGYFIGHPDGVEGPIDLWPVVLHEVGHWFGVPHSEIVGKGRASDVMNERHETGPACVSGQSLTMLNNAADTRWNYKATSGGALMPKRRH